jgi:hypothetical protein
VKELTQKYIEVQRCYDRLSKFCMLTSQCIGIERATGRTVAIKKIKLVQTEIGSQGIELSAIREVKCLRELRHPNIIEVS